MLQNMTIEHALQNSSLERFETEILLAHFLKKERIWLKAHNEETLSPSQKKKFDTLIRRRQKHEPIAYILGKKEFYGRSFCVNKDVLIPRPETELMIELIQHTEGRGDHAPTIWDVGTGSGAIAITLAHEIPHAKLLATDISSRALMIAKKNASRLGVKNRITFLKSNLLEKNSYNWLKKQTTKNNLIICANLPYLPNSDKQKLDADVVKFEPSRALFSGKDGLDLIRKLLGQLSRHLPEWGYSNVTLLFEFDPPQAKILQALAKKIFPTTSIEVTKDLAKLPRILSICIQTL